MGTQPSGMRDQLYVVHARPEAESMDLFIKDMVLVFHQLPFVMFYPISTYSCVSSNHGPQYALS